MSAPKITIIANGWVEEPPKGKGFLWWCQACSTNEDGCPWCAIDIADTIAEAADAGRKHLAEHHTPTVGTYCRAHGCQRVQCGCSATPHDPQDRLDANAGLRPHTCSGQGEFAPSATTRGTTK